MLKTLPYDHIQSQVAFKSISYFRCRKTSHRKQIFIDCQNPWKASNFLLLYTLYVFVLLEYRMVFLMLDISIELARIYYLTFPYVYNGI